MMHLGQKAKHLGLHYGQRAIHHTERLGLELFVLVVSLAALLLLGIERDYLQEAWGIDTTNLRVIAYKFAQITAAMSYFHLSRKWLFPYFDLSEELQKPVPIGAAAMLILQGLVVLAFMLGL